jgi:hypothetical protein
MLITFKYNGILIQLHYDNADGHLKYVINQSNGKKMKKETYEEDDGYRFVDKMGATIMQTCNVDCVRIVDLDIFVPKFIFIENVH